MFGKKKTSSKIDKEQLELLENAHQRINQKKRLYNHFIVFLIGSLLLIVANVYLGIGKDFSPFNIDWFVYAIILWFALLVYHVFTVFITHKFMGKAWEQKQLEKLINKQKQRIEELKADLPQIEELIEQKTAVKALGNESSEKKTELTLIVAVAENNAIGKDNKLIWHLKDDLQRFKSLTSQHHIIMGRKTFESFPKPLPNRTHIVISSQKEYKVPEDVIVVNSLEEAIKAVKNDTQPFIIGGGQIYKQALNIADKIELTRVHENFEADTFFPEIDSNIWKETSNEFHKKDKDNEYEYSFITYVRK